MENFTATVQKLVLAGKIRVSEHGYDELSDDQVTSREVVSGVSEAILIEEYPDYPKGPCALYLSAERYPW